MIVYIWERIMLSKMRQKKLPREIWTCSCGRVVFQNAFAYTHFNMFVDEWTTANKGPAH